MAERTKAHPNDSPKWLAFVPPVDDGKGPYRLITKTTQHVVATLTADAAHPDAKVDAWMLYAPQVPDLPCQKDVKTTFVPAGTVVREHSPLKRPLILTRIADGRKNIHAVLTIEATLLSRELIRIAPGDTDVTAVRCSA